MSLIKRALDLYERHIIVMERREDRLSGKGVIWGDKKEKEETTHKFAFGTIRKDNLNLGFKR